MRPKKETRHSPGPLFSTNELNASLPQIPVGAVLSEPLSLGPLVS